ncbi:MAG: NAD(P)/FAD-dependent oxidoreductase [Candidatus Altiarchaeota archaeon]
MKDLTVDVVIVGAGPAGSIAAVNLAKAGVDVLVLEKRQEIGAPKRCAEGLNIMSLKKHGIDPNPRWAVQRIVSASLYSPSGKRILVQNQTTEGFVLERKNFEKHLAAEAIKAGARYMVKTLVTDVVIDGGGVRGVRAEYLGEEFSVSSRIVIAADGVDSLMAKKAGINTLNHLKDYHSGFQYEMGGLKNFDEQTLAIYFGNDVAPKGYVWIFPKGNRTANVGIGIVGTRSDEGSRARDYLDRFIENHPEIFEGASPIEVNAGGIPVSAAVDTFVLDGFMVVGDAAQQVNPIHGGGIGLAMDAAKLAAGIAAEAIREGDVSRERLSEYERVWHEKDGAYLEKLMRIRLFLEKCDDNDFEGIADIVSGEDVLKVMSGDYKYLLKIFVAKAPKLLPLARKFLS